MKSGCSPSSWKWRCWNGNRVAQARGDHLLVAGKCTPFMPHTNTRSASVRQWWPPTSVGCNQAPHTSTLLSTGSVMEIYVSCFLCPCSETLQQWLPFPLATPGLCKLCRNLAEANPQLSSSVRSAKGFLSTTLLFGRKLVTPIKKAPAERVIGK